MEPTLKNGSEVLVSGIPFLFSRQKIGNIVAFEKNDRIFVKRIKKVKGDRYFLAGDNEKDSINTWVSKEDIIGKIIFKL